MCNTLRSIHITSLGSNSAQKHLVIGFLHRKVFDNSYYFLVLLVLLKLFMWSWFDLVYGICLKSTLFLHFPNMLKQVSPSIQFYKGEHPSKPGSYKVCPCSRIKTQCHCPWLLSLPLLPATSRVYSFIICSITSSPAALGALPLVQSRHPSAWMHLS